MSFEPKPAEPMPFGPMLSAIEPNGNIPPVERWHPESSGEMDLLIRADGQWIHEGRVFERERLVRLLSTVLRRELDGHHYLVSPVEKWRIRVEDRAFQIVDAECLDGVWWLVTNVGDRLSLDEEHRLTLSATPGGDMVPEVPVRFGLAARLGRNVFYRLADIGDERTVEGRRQLGLISDGVWQPLGELEGS